MNNTLAICRKELRRYFASPIGYVLLITSGSLFGLGVYARDPTVLMGPVLGLSGFSPPGELAKHPRLALLIGLARVVIMYLIPMTTMRLFIEERRNRTIEMLFTSPVRERDIVLGKWIGAMLLYLAMLAVSAVEVVIFRWSDLDFLWMLAAYVSLMAQGAGLLAIGEYMSTVSRHESVAAAWTLLGCIVILRFCATGVLNPLGYGVCGVLTIAGWLLTSRSVRALRWAY
jgi:ABC-2 type transport system permease protein